MHECNSIHECFARTGTPVHTHTQAYLYSPHNDLKHTPACLHELIRARTRICTRQERACAGQDAQLAALAEQVQAGRGGGGAAAAGGG